MAVARELDRELIDRFNADARPLSSEALDSLRERVLTAQGENAAAGEQIVQAVLAKLANGTETFTLFADSRTPLLEDRRGAAALGLAGSTCLHVYTHHECTTSAHGLEHRRQAVCCK